MCCFSQVLSPLPHMTGCDMLLFLVVTVQIKLQGIVWSTNNHVSNSTHIFRTAKLNVINNEHMYCSRYNSLTIPGTVTPCWIILFILKFKVQVVLRQCIPKKHKLLASFMIQQSKHRTWRFIFDRHPKHNWQIESDGCICEALHQASGKGWTYVVYGQFRSISCLIWLSGFCKNKILWYSPSIL